MNRSTSAVSALTMAFCGKGGVGKTTTATATALWLASQGKRVCLLDTDRGHSVPRALGLNKADIPVNTLCNTAVNLDIVVIDATKFVNVVEATQNLGWGMDQYLAQFPDDKGLIAWADILNGFFGAPTDIVTLEKFVVLVGFLVELQDKDYDYIIIDVEPTAGLERLLSGADRMSNSILKLSKQSGFFLTLLGAKMPHVRDYLVGSYIKEADYYTGRIQWAVAMIRAAAFFLVCIPEEEPIRQTIDVRELITGFGGKVAGCIVNRSRTPGALQPNHDELIGLLKSHEVSILHSSERPQMHVDPDDKRRALQDMGGEICKHYSL